ncbi:MAG: type IV secretion system DNA-binding domain-containing protein [Hyphomonas oceanitis]|uniref:type IV secretion system DNA-binding domain-containing protein n=1 Tax=Hyphomonas oceanitis TaxID=81033 RepID=UPI003003A53A
MPSIRKLLAGAGCILVLATLIFYQFAVVRATPTYPLPSGEIVALHPSYMTGCGKAELFARIGVAKAQNQKVYCDDVLSSAGIRGAVYLRWMIFAAGVLATVLLFAFALIALRIEKSAPKVVRGPVRLTGRKAYAAIRKTSRKEIRQTGAGIDFPPGLAMSRDRESRHCLISGSVGSGKTQTIQHMILEAMRWGDKMLILDTKGDMTERLPGEITLIAPQDKRSAVWDISADCVTKQDARELAARFIPKSSDPMWAEAARELLVACIVSLQREMPATWSWGDLHARALLSAEALKDMALIHHPAAAHMIGDPASKTAMSILTTFKAHIHVLEAMAEAWSAEGQEKFSAANWLTDPHATNSVILQRDGRYPQLTNAWIGGLVSLVSSHVCSPAFGESSQRRIWLFLDEFPQLEAMDDLASLLDLGRSKGVCVVLAAQDTSQIRIRYGRDRTNAWLSMIGTHIIGRMNPGEGADDISRAIGMQEIERESRSKSHSGGNSSVNISTEHSLRAVITSSELSSRLGRKGRKVRMLVLGFGENVHEIDLPITILPPQRPANVPADWTRPDQKTAAPEPSPARPALPVQRPQKAGLLSADDIVRIRKPKPGSVD